MDKLPLTGVFEGWKRGDPIGYMRPIIPSFELPAYRGQRYTALVPDTLDLQERAALAINGLTEPTDPLADYELYWAVSFLDAPAMMTHNYADLCQIKFQEALPLLRVASGTSQNLAVEQRWMEVLLHQIGPDGLPCLPKRGRPWYATDWPQNEYPLGDEDQLLVPFYIGRALSVLTLCAMRDHGGPWRDAIRTMIDGLIELAVDDGHCAWFWPGVLYAEKVRPPGVTMPLNMSGCEARTVPLGLVHAYRLLGYPPALDLAKKVITFLREQYFEPDGTFASIFSRHPEVQKVKSEYFVHFHAHSAALLSMLEYAQVTSDHELLDFVVRGYEYGKSQGECLDSGESSSLLGYFPEYIGNDIYWTSELCEVADMIALAIKLSQAGAGDYWDDADRWVRNLFAESQLRRTDWIERVPSSMHREWGGRRPTAMDETYQTTERVAERNVGAFASWPAPNDWFVGHGHGIMHCCTGNAARAIYYVWDNILTRQGAELKVNLLLNRASPWVDVDSHIPYAGQVDVKVKAPLSLAVRIPEWVQPGDVRVQVNGQDRRNAWNGRYANVGEVKPGDVATLTFPILERKATVHIQHELYRLVLKGNEVVVIHPPGRYAPLFQRDHYRENTTRWKKIERFVSEEEIHW